MNLYEIIYLITSVLFLSMLFLFTFPKENREMLV